MSITKRTSTLVESASASSITPDMSTASVGDLVIVTTANSVGGAPTISTGWTAVFAPTAYTSSNGIGCWYRFLTGAAADTPTITTGAASRNSAIATPLAGVDTSSPLDVAVSTNLSGTAAQSLTLTGVTTVTPNAYLLTGCAIDGTSSTFTLTQPTGMTLEKQTTGSGRREATASLLQAAAGASGNKTWTMAGATNLAMAGYLLALRPAPDTGPEPGRFLLSE